MIWAETGPEIVRELRDVNRALDQVNTNLEQLMALLTELHADSQRRDP